MIQGWRWIALDAYRYCLDTKSDQKAFEKWFMNLSWDEYKKHIQIPALNALKSAVCCCIPGASEFYYDPQQGPMIKLAHEGLLPFDYLSDGFRNMVAMVSDIIHRASKLNPHFGNDVASRITGVVLIDEIDLHLHPKWQRRVIEDISRIFPNLQFIMTTHSPFIIQSLKPGQLIDLEQPVATRVPPHTLDAFPAPQNAFSERSIEDITEDILDKDK